MSSTDRDGARSGLCDPKLVRTARIAYKASPASILVAEYETPDGPMHLMEWMGGAVALMSFQLLAANRPPSHVLHQFMDDHGVDFWAVDRQREVVFVRKNS